MSGGRYIPPHMRKSSQAEPKTEAAPSQPAPTSTLKLTLDDITNHFWPPKEGVDSGYELDQSGETEGRTLHAAASDPGRLAYVFLFDQANPRWETDCIIYTKSNLDLLPVLTSTHDSAPSNKENDAPNTDLPAAEHDEPTPNSKSVEPRGSIAFFKQISGIKRHSDYKFEGWFTVDKVTFLQPQSEELIRMLEQKWTLRDHKGNEYMGERDRANWKRSLAFRWAVVKFAKDELAERERGEPDIQRGTVRRRRQAGPTKSVNEMLAEMRMKDSQGDEASGAG